MNIAANPLELLRTITRVLALHHPDDEINRKLVYRVADAPEIQDDWEKRIIELGDGRSVGEIIEIIFKEELRAGAWVADIGLWSNFLARGVVKVINDLVDRGGLRLRDADGSRATARKL